VTAATRSRSCTGSTATRTWPRRPWTTWRAGAVHGRCASATAPPASCSSTSTENCWTGLCAARRGSLGDPRRPQGLHLRPVPELGSAGPGHPDGRHHGRPANLTRWTTERDAIYRQVMERGSYCGPFRPDRVHSRQVTLRRPAARAPARPAPGYFSPLAGGQLRPARLRTT
jgi:hypothetical protein